MLAAAVIVVALAPAGEASARSQVTVASSIGGHPAAKSSERHPIHLSARPTEVDVQVTNRGTSDIVGRTVQLSGSVLGLTFFSYETSVRIDVPPGATTDLRFNLDLSALKGQVTGLIPASVAVLDANRHHLASQSLIVDVSGSRHSVYAVFGLVLLLLTALGIAEVVRALSQEKLPSNRWSRGFRFLLPGIGVGFVVVIGASILSILAPKLNRSLPILLIAALAMFAVGYFTPSPEPTDGEIVEEEDPAFSQATGTGPPRH